MPETFPAEYKPDTKASRTVDFRILQAEFGDGYGASNPDGINTKKVEWKLTFSDYSAIDVAIMTDFLDARAMVESFLWTPPRETEATLWKQKEAYEVTFNGGLLENLDVTFKRVYL